MRSLNIPWHRFFPFGPALLAGAVAMLLVLLTVERWPLRAPMLLYGTLAFFFAFLLPRYSWRWGCAVALGIPIAIPILILLGVAGASGTPPSFLPIPYADFIVPMTIFAFLPALLGGLMGAVGGTLAGRQRDRRAARTSNPE